MNENKFSGKANIYSMFRPTYPETLFSYLKMHLGLNTETVVADIGSGTGIFTKQLLDEGYFVYAVEPNEDMRKTAEKQLSNYNRFTSICRLAEQTKLKDCSVNFITATQAFHWFDIQKFKLECKRILKPNGKVILVWNTRNKHSLITKENAEINKKYCPNFKGFSGGMTDCDLRFDEFFSGRYETVEFSNNLFFNEQQFVGRNLSSSYSLKEGDKDYLAYIAELKTIFYKHSKNDILLMPNTTICYIGIV